MAALKKNPNLIMLKEEKPVVKTMSEVIKTKPIGEEAAKTDAWWHDGYMQAKQIETEIKNGTYKAPETPKIRRDDGSLNLGYFHSFDDDGLI